MFCALSIPAWAAGYPSWQYNTLELQPFTGSGIYYELPFYSASATSELKGGGYPLCRVLFEFSDGSWAVYVFGDVNQELLVQMSRTVKTSYVKMTILDVYFGDCDDTCIYLVKAYCS